MAILKKRGKPPRWSTRSAAELFLQSSDSEKPKDLVVNPKNTLKGNIIAICVHAWGKHSTDHCNQFKILKHDLFNRKTGKRRIPSHTRQALRLAVTLMPQSDGDILRKGFSPNSQVGKMQERQQQHKTKSMRVHVCQRCTGFAGATIRHNIGSCFSDGRTAIPDWFSTSHVGLLNELNRLHTRAWPALVAT
jgi:hypothetical protein